MERRLSRLVGSLSCLSRLSIIHLAVMGVCIEMNLYIDETVFHH